MNNQALVLGGGPTGMIAAAQLVYYGYDVKMIAASPPRLPRGAFFLHELPIGVRKYAQVADTVCYYSVGLPEKYSAKQWGDVYPSSFPGDAIRQTVWWPDGLLEDALLRDVVVVKETFEPTARAVREAAEYHDLVILTFPLKDRNAVAKYWTPMAVATLAEIQHVYDGELEPGWLLYDGQSHGWHRHIVRVSTPPKAFARGEVYVELTKTSKLIHQVWPERTFWIPDLHPLQQEQNYDDLLPANVILAGRLATGDPTYLSSDVMDSIHSWQDMRGH